MRMNAALENEIHVEFAECKIIDILEGNVDLVVPRVRVFVSAFSSSPDGSWLLELRVRPSQSKQIYLTDHDRLPDLGITNGILCVRIKG